MNIAEQNVINFIRENKERGTRLLQRLVQEGSIRGKESKAQAVIIEKCRELGLELDIWEIGDEELRSHPAFCSDRKDFSGNPNVVGVLKGEGGGKSIILNGHIDVVPVGENTAWKHDPFSGHIEDGRLYGRGSTDMKGGTAALLLAMEALIKSGIRLKGDLIFQSVIEEESGGAGTLAAILRGYRADGALIPEPTNMKFFPKQQGSMWFRIKVEGVQAHGGTRYEGVSAIEKVMLIIGGLQELEKKRNEELNDPLFSRIPIPIPINIGKIQSGEWPSSVPDLAIIEGRMGVAPSETLEDAMSAMETAVSRLAESDAWLSKHPPSVEWFGAKWFPGSLETDDALVTTLAESFAAIRNEDPVIEASPWATDGGYLDKVGNTPVLIFGPGTTRLAHETNEYIELDQMFQSAEIIALALMKWCENVQE
ncbi:peptidase [Mesobacillus zeae]|uniref:Peptidase n=1 Tax=Mesobacillus zeae TaxID=1917180 RepID=A0A398B2E1_9BACI|nr:peptidase [Mesobacillus zeae]RID84119.1 peptidase [Mesobacillus zeae]